jgi:hypothetical protein
MIAHHSLEQSCITYELHENKNRQVSRRMRTFTDECLLRHHG